MINCSYWSVLFLFVYIGGICFWLFMIYVLMVLIELFIMIFQYSEVSGVGDYYYFQFQSVLLVSIKQEFLEDFLQENFLDYFKGKGKKYKCLDKFCDSFLDVFLFVIFDCFSSDVGFIFKCFKQ